MAERDTIKRNFLRHAKWEQAAITPLAGDASARRYERLHNGTTGESAVLMIAPPKSGEDVSLFVEVAKILGAWGYSAPKILALDQKNGFVLLEDLGDDLFARAAAGDPALESDIYAAATDLLIDLHGRAAPESLPSYSRDVYLNESRLLWQWYMPAATGVQVSQNFTDRFDNLIAAACDSLNTDRPVLVMRDYHAENLLWLPERTGLARVGLLDFQDALSGHRAYDLISLIEDARRDTTAELRETMIARYILGTNVDEQDFRQALAVLGAQRNIKIIGIFARLCVRDGKSAYVDMIPRVWDHLQRDLAHPALDDLRTLLENHVVQPDKQTCDRIRKARP